MWRCTLTTTFLIALNTANAQSNAFAPSTGTFGQVLSVLIKEGTNVAQDIARRAAADGDSTRGNSPTGARVLNILKDQLVGVNTITSGTVAEAPVQSNNAPKSTEELIASTLNVFKSFLKNGQSALVENGQLPAEFIDVNGEGRLQGRLKSMTEPFSEIAKTRHRRISATASSTSTNNTLGPLKILEEITSSSSVLDDKPNVSNTSSFPGHKSIFDAPTFRVTAEPAAASFGERRRLDVFPEGAQASIKSSEAHLFGDDLPPDEAALEATLLELSPDELLYPDAHGGCGVPNMMFFNDHSEVAKERPISAADCATLCKARDSCAYYTFILATRRCFFFPSHGTKVGLVAGVFSGSRRCRIADNSGSQVRSGSIALDLNGLVAPQKRRLQAPADCFAYDTEILGTKLKIQEAIGAAQSCHRLCGALNGCKYFSHSKSHQRCTLYSKAHGVTETFGTVSGPVSCSSEPAPKASAAASAPYSHPDERISAYGVANSVAESNVPIGRLVSTPEEEASLYKQAASDQNEIVTGLATGEMLTDESVASSGNANTLGARLMNNPLGSTIFGAMLGGGGNSPGANPGSSNGAGGILGSLLNGFGANNNAARAASRESEGLEGMAGIAQSGLSLANMASGAQNLFGAMQSMMAAGDTVMKTFPIADLVKTGYQLSNSGLLRPAGVVNRNPESSPPEGVPNPEVVCLSEGMRCCIPREAAPNYQKSPPLLNGVASQRCQATYVSASDQLCATTRYADETCGTQVVETSAMVVYRNRMVLASRTMNDALCECSISKQQGAQNGEKPTSSGAAKWEYSLLAAEEGADVREKARDAADKLSTAARVGVTWLDVLGASAGGGGASPSAAGGGSATSFLNSIIDLADEMKSKKITPNSVVTLAQRRRRLQQSNGQSVRLRVRNCTMWPRACSSSLFSFLRDPDRCNGQRIVVNGCRQRKDILVQQSSEDVVPNKHSTNDLEQSLERGVEIADDEAPEKLFDLAIQLPSELTAVEPEGYHMACDFELGDSEDWTSITDSNTSLRDIPLCDDIPRDSQAVSEDASGLFDGLHIDLDSDLVETWKNVADNVVNGALMMASQIQEIADMDTVTDWLANTVKPWFTEAISNALSSIDDSQVPAEVTSRNYLGYNIPPSARLTVITQVFSDFPSEKTPNSAQAFPLQPGLWSTVFDLTAANNDNAVHLTNALERTWNGGVEFGNLRGGELWSYD